ncbi:hypothetical protein B0H13DRAFT_1896604 [Mycena leptocephala]|nr:hypothetical protein B0H13DRAFT_1896604 [Mycena leptocephala]
MLAQLGARDWSADMDEERGDTARETMVLPAIEEDDEERKIMNTVAPKMQNSPAQIVKSTTGDAPTAAAPAPAPEPAQAPRAHAHRARVNYYTADGNPPKGSFTQAPPHGFRRVYGLTSGILYRNHPTEQRRQWDGVAHPKIIATIASGNGDRMHTASLLRDHIASRFNMDPSDLLIGPPGQAEGPGPDPIAWLVGGLSAPQATALLEIQALVSDTLTAFFFPYTPPITGFMGTFYGFTIPTDNDDLALAVIGDAAMADPAITRFIRAHRNAFPANMTADEVLARVGESIWVAPIPLLSLRSVPFTAWNVYFGPPALFAKLVIDTPFHGQGRIFYRPLRCTICPGTDHPTNLCPFPEYPGWLGATPATIGALLEASRDALNPRGKSSNRMRDNTKPNGKRNDKGKGKGNGKGKGKDRDGGH